MSTGGARRQDLVRTLLIAAVLTLALVYFASVLHSHYPIHKWLFWRYARAWGAAAVWTLACLVAGHALLRMLLRRVLPILEHLVFSFGLGAFAFFLLMVLAGLLQLYGSGLFFALPLLMIAAGARPALRYGRSLVRHLRAARARSATRPPWWSLPLLLSGFLAVLGVYLPLMLPENASFDACWYHLPIAEHYVAAGGLVAFKEGWHLGAFPQLASILYTWAFLQPFTLLFDRVELCAHLELVMFLWTLASVPLLVRRLLPRERASWSWLVMFLFPGLYVYDSSLVVGADHIAAFWTVPIYVGLLRTWKRFELRWALLTAVFTAAALDTKYTAFSVVIAPLAALCARALYLSVRQPGRRAWIGFAAFAATSVLMTAPHWAKNWVFYGDPLYPALWRHLHVHPWTADSGLRYAPEYWAPSRDLAGLWQTAKALWTFSFVPNDWEQFHGQVPVFGSLFTLTLLSLPVLRETRRIWGLVACTLAGVFAWYTVSHQDRYLQVLVPWMAASTASVLILVWRTGRLARIALVPLVAMQAVWAIGVYFVPSHNMLFQHPLRVLTELGGAWFRKDYEARLDRFPGAARAGKLLDKKSDVVLVHEKRAHLGLRTRSVSDHPRFQSGISYAQLRSPREVWELYRRLEITHLLFADSSEGSDSYAGDLVFWDFARRHTKDSQAVGGLTLARVTHTPPDDRPFGDVVALVACRREFANGLYHLQELAGSAASPRPFERAAMGQELDQQIGRADFVIHDPSCQRRLPEQVMSELVSLTRRGAESLYVRKTSP